VEKELELRFLALDLPDFLTKAESAVIEDIYMPIDADHCQLRLRSKGSRFEITKKVPLNENDLSEMIEYTIPLSEAEYLALGQVRGKVLKKQRFNIQMEGARVEVGVYLGLLEGLVVIDVEFDDRDQKERFVPPSWFGSEVTNDKSLAGGELCGVSLEDLEIKLNRYNWKRISAV
jgi:adenylate cyclase